MALLVESAVEVGRCKSVWSRRDDRGFAGARQGFADTGIGVKGFVGDQLAGRHLRQQRVGAKEIVGLSRGQQKSERIAERIDQSMDFGAQSAAATSDRVILVFFWEHRHCADAPARWCCRSSHIRYRRRRRDIRRFFARPRSEPND